MPVSAEMMNHNKERLNKDLKEGKLTPDYVNQQVNDTERRGRQMRELGEHVLGKLRSRVEGLKKIPPDELRERIEENKEEIQQTKLILELGEGIVYKEKYRNHPPYAELTKKLENLEEETPLLEKIKNREI